MAVTTSAYANAPAPSTQGTTQTLSGALSAGGLFTLTGVEDALVAHAGGTQAAALALSSTKNYHRIGVCATAGDSVALPAATVGQAHFVRNDGAASCQVFGTTPDTINGVVTTTGVALPAGIGRWYVCLTASQWVTNDAAITTGSGANVLATSPALVTPNIGAATALSLNSGTGFADSLAQNATQLAFTPPGESAYLAWSIDAQGAQTQWSCLYLIVLAPAGGLTAIAIVPAAGYVSFVVSGASIHIKQLFAGTASLTYGWLRLQ